MTALVSVDINDLAGRAALGTEDFGLLLGCGADRVASLRAGVADPTASEARRLLLLADELNGGAYDGLAPSLVRRRLIVVDDATGMSRLRAISLLGE